MVGSNLIKAGLMDTNAWISVLICNCLGTAMTVSCLAYVKIKLHLNSLIKRLLILATLHDVLLHIWVFTGVSIFVLFDVDIEALVCTVFFAGVHIFATTAHILVSQVSFVRFYLTWKIRNHQIANEEKLNSWIYVSILIHYLFQSFTFYLVFQSRDLTQENSNTCIERLMPLIGIPLIMLFIAILSGIFCDLLMIRYLQKVNNANLNSQMVSTSATGSHIPWKSGPDAANVPLRVPISATLLSAGIIIAFITSARIAITQEWLGIGPALLCKCLQIPILILVIEGKERICTLIFVTPSV